MSEIKRKRVDIELNRYQDLVSYQKANLEEPKYKTDGARVLMSIDDIYIKSKDSIKIDSKLRDNLEGFRKFGILKGANEEEAINEALKVYIKEHKEELQNKIGEL
jgi:hypothetical protein